MPSTALTSLRFLVPTALVLILIPSAVFGEADRWEKQIAEFEFQAEQEPPPKDAILFTGSSSIRRWELSKWFPQRKTIQRGFGGSQMSDLIRYAERIIIPHQPRVVVIYSGDNDLASGKSPREVAADFQTLQSQIQKALPKTRILLIGVKPSPKRAALIDAMRDANGRMQKICEDEPQLTFIDVLTPMLDDQGQPRDELFVEDKLHLNEAGYRLWTEMINAALMGGDRKAG